jgi:hypothetical protein
MNSEEQEACSDGEIEIISADNPQIKHEVPEDGNKEVKSTLWTAVELKQHDKKMRGWARWEVDKSAHVVRSMKCARLTTNWDKICDECHEILGDESFKYVVRKVKTQQPVQAELIVIVSDAEKLRGQVTCGPTSSNARGPGEVRPIDIDQHQSSCSSAQAEGSPSFQCISVAREGGRFSRFLAAISVRKRRETKRQRHFHRDM